MDEPLAFEPRGEVDEGLSSGIVPHSLDALRRELRSDPAVEGRLAQSKIANAATLGQRRITRFVLANRLLGFLAREAEKILKLLNSFLSVHAAMIAHGGPA